MWNVHSGIIHDSPKLETAQIPFSSKWINCDILTEWQFNKAKKKKRLELTDVEQKNSDTKEYILYDSNIKEFILYNSIYIKLKKRLNQWVSVV